MNEGFNLLIECLQRYSPAIETIKKTYMLSFCSDSCRNKQSTSMETVDLEMWNNILQRIEK